MNKSEISILIVEDDMSFRKSLTEAVKRFGYRVTDTGKSEEALNLVKIRAFNAAIIDCMLPKLNGIDLAIEMRRSRFGKTPIILMSGVFKDKSFSAESMEKTEAMGFLQKPFDLNNLRSMLEQAFKELTSTESVPLQVLISKTIGSSRERTKIIEGLEEVKGFDLPFVLCVLMDASASGHLNIVNGSSEVYGITLNQGKVVKVDSSDSLATTSAFLIDQKYIRSEDLEALGPKGKRGDIIATLIEEQYLSPHVLPIVRKEQISADLMQLFVDETVKINFVPDRIKEKGFGFDLEDLTPLLHEVVASVISPEYLHGFFKDWLEYPIQVGPHFDKGHKVFELPVLKKLPGLADLIKGDLTMDEICAKGNYNREDFYRALHMLVFRRLVIFHDVKKTKDAVEYGERMKNMLKDLQGKNPFQVFSYFGAGEAARETEVDRIYKEFSRANHPDLLPPNTPMELRKVVDGVFSIVSDANNVLTHPERRQRLVDELKTREAEVQIQSEAMAEEAVVLLRRGRAAEALAKTKEALARHPSRNIKITYAWALLKAPNENSRYVDKEVSKILDSIPHEERRIAQYYFVMGLLKRYLGDAKGALAQFDKALALDTGFLDARREKSALEDKADGEKVDIFNADLTKLVGNFFKRKG